MILINYKMMDSSWCITQFTVILVYLSGSSVSFGWMDGMVLLGQVIDADGNMSGVHS